MCATRSRRLTSAIVASLPIIVSLSVARALAQQKKPSLLLISKQRETRPQSLGTLIHALKDSNPIVRRRAAEGLGNYLGDPEKKVTDRVVVQTEQIRSLNISGRSFELLTIAPGIFPGAPAPPTSHAYSSIPITRLVTNLKSKSRIVRADSAKELGTREDLKETAVSALIETARNDSDPAVRAACVEAIGKIYERPEVLSALEQSLSDSDGEVRAQAADGLANQLAHSSRSHTMDPYTREAILQKLSGTLKDSNPNARRNAIVAIGSVGVESKRLAPQVVLSLRDQDSDVRLTALLNLRENMSPDPSVVVTGLANALYDSEQQIRYETVVYLDSLGSAAGPAVPALNHVLSDDSKPIVLVAIKVLGQVGESAIDAIPGLVTVMEMADEGMRTTKVEDKSRMARQTEDEKIRKAAGLAISNLATVAETAKRTDKIDVLEGAYRSLANYDDSVMREYAKNVRRAIDNLVLVRRMKFWVFLRDNLYLIAPILVGLFYLVFIVLFVLAPVSKYSQGLIMTSFAHNVLSLGAVHVMLMVVPPLRRHLLRRYLRTIRTERDFTQWEDQFVIPNENLLPENIGTDLVKKRKLLFIGPSGIGKTCFFKYLTFRHARKKNLKQELLPKQVIPVFLPLERFHDMPVEQMFHARLERFGLITDDKLSTLFLKQGGFLVLIDGLNEVDEKTRRRVIAFIETYGSANYICASSQEAYEFTWIDRIDLSPLGEEKIQEILRRRLGAEMAESTIRQFEGATFELYSVPQDLDFAIELVEQGKPLPQSRPELYDAMLAPILDSWIQAGQTDYPPLLYNRAYEMLKTRSISFEEAALLPTEVRDPLVERKLLVRRGDRYQFRHDLVKAYLAAKYFAPKWSQLFSEEETIESNWRPMLEFAMLNLSPAEHIEDLFNGLLKRNIQMAADLFGWLNQSQPTLCGEWAVNFKRRYADAVLSNV